MNNGIYKKQGSTDYGYFRHPRTIIHKENDVPENLSYWNVIDIGETLISFIEKELS